ncbi:MAG: enoyl-ACP reductase [Elusimicrobia bacterium]|nr:enoyl-ACP reductase [Elusimicrobiota bacterium]
MGSLSGKTALVFGVASETSIAWAISQELAKNGAKIWLGYQFRYHSRIKDIAPQLPNLAGYERCDVSKEEELEAFFKKLQSPIDILVHAIAFAPATAFEGPVLQTSEADFSQALTVSSHSLPKMVKYAAPLMSKGGSVITLTYLGGQRVCANYKVMGVAKAALEAYVRELAHELGPQKIRVNAISAGPIKTLAASGIPNFDLILDYHKSVAPLRDNVTQEDVARCAAFLASDESRMITGQTIFVDGGYSIVGVPALS